MAVSPMAVPPPPSQESSNSLSAVTTLSVYWSNEAMQHCHK